MAGLSVGDQNPSPLAEPVSMSAAKKAKANFEKVAKKKPDPEGLSVAEQAQTALTGKDFATAKDLFEKAQAVCEGSEAKAVKVPKVGLGNQGTPGARVARLWLMTVHRAARTSRREGANGATTLESCHRREGKGILLWGTSAPQGIGWMSG
jgi:hypothetical protein